VDEEALGLTGVLAELTERNGRMSIHA
jgi:hypothetical protein